MSEITLKKNVTIIIPDIKEVTPDNVEEVMKTALTKPDYIENVLLHLEDTFGDLLIKEIVSEEDLPIFEQANKVLRSARNRTKDICFASRAEYNRLAQESLDLQNSTVKRISALEDPIKEKIESYKQIAIERQKKEEAEKKLPIRTKLLEGAGIKIVPDEFQFLSDTDFLTYFNTKTEEKKALEEAERIRIENERKIEEDKKKAVEDALKNAWKDLRDKDMQMLGFKKSEVSGRFIFEIINVGVWEAPFEKVYAGDQTNFDVYLAELSTQVERIKKQKADMDAEATRKRIEAETLAKIEADKKAKALADEKAKLAEIKKKALLPDKQKLQDFVDSLKWDYPIVSTDAGNAIIARAKYLIDTSKKDLQARINQL